MKLFTLKYGVSWWSLFGAILSTHCKQPKLATPYQETTKLNQISPVMAYAHRGTLKPGVIAHEHAVIHHFGEDPQACYFPGEYEGGMTKEPIAVTPSDGNTLLKRESRIRFGKAYSIEWNVKVKDIGMVVSEDITKLVAYYKEENKEE